MRVWNYLTIISLVLIPYAASAEPAKPSDARTYISQSLDVAPFVPPAPVAPKRLPAIREDAVVAIPGNFSRTTTIIRGEASTAPDLPEPAIADAAPTISLTAEEVARFDSIRRHTLMLGATVYDHAVSRVQWRNPDSGDAYEADCGFDIGLLAGIGGFVRGGENYSLYLMHTDFDSKALRKFSPPSAFVPPQVPPGEIVMISGDPDSGDLMPILAVKSVIAAEKERLTAFQAARREYFRASAEWHAANPPIPRDETIILQPHRGSRYLAEPRPESKGATQ